MSAVAESGALAGPAIAPTRRISAFILPQLRRLILWVFAVWCLFPIYWLVTMSLKEGIDVIARPPRFLFRPVWTNYLAVLSSSDIWTYFKNSLIVGLGSTAMALALGIPAAYILARYRFRGKPERGASFPCDRAAAGCSRATSR